MMLILYLSLPFNTKLVCCGLITWEWISIQTQWMMLNFTVFNSWKYPCMTVALKLEFLLAFFRLLFLFSFPMFYKCPLTWAYMAVLFRSAICETKLIKILIDFYLPELIIVFIFVCIEMSFLFRVQLDYSYNIL